MPRALARILILVLASLTSMPAASLAVDAVPLGPEFRVSPVGDTYTNARDGSAWDPRAVPTSDGGFAVVWESYSYDYGYFYSSYGRGIRMRRFGPTGAPKGGETKVYFDEDGYGYFRPSLGIDANDQFTVVWSNYEAVGGGEEKGRVWARRFNEAGNPLSERFEVTPDGGADSNAQARTEVAVGPDGGFLVVWEDYVQDPDDNLILARRYDAAGVAQGTPFQVNQEPIGSRGYPTVAADESGNFTVVWTDWGRIDTTGRRFGPTGTPLGSEFEILDHDNDELANRAAAGPGGNVMVLGFDGGGLTGRILDANGVPVGGEFVVDPEGVYGEVEAGPDGSFLVAWQDNHDGDVFGRWFSPTGAPAGARFQVNEPNGFYQSNPGLSVPAIAIDDAGDFVVAWANDYAFYPEDPDVDDREGPGVWGRRFSTCGNGLIGRTESCDDGNSAQEDGCSSRCRSESCFHCSGEPSTCTQAAGCTAVCIDGAAVEKPSLTFSKIGAPLGDESLGFRGKILSPAFDPGEYDPSTEGARIVVNGANLIYDSGSVPPGLVGTGCNPKDGWKVGGSPLARTYTYKNVSGAFPPGCVAGSANGIRALSLKDKLGKEDKLHFKVKVVKGSIPAVPPPPVTAAVILGPSPAAGLAGRCGLVHFENAIGTRFFP